MQQKVQVHLYFFITLPQLMHSLKSVIVDMNPVTAQLWQSSL